MVSLLSLHCETIRALLGWVRCALLGWARRDFVGESQRDGASDYEYGFHPDPQRRAAASPAGEAAAAGTVHARGPEGIQLRYNRHLPRRNCVQLRKSGWDG